MIKKLTLKKIFFGALLAISLNIANAQTGAALDFDGVNDYIDIVDNAALNPSQFTIETWVKWGASGTLVNFICGKTAEQMEIHTGGTYNNIRFIPTTGVYLDGGVNTITPGTWTHIACVYDPSISLAKMYINGVDIPYMLGGSNPLTTAAVTSTVNFLIGQRSGLSFPFSGQLDEFRVWNIVRTQCEINTYMNCEIPSTASGLIANYHFNEGIAASTNTVNSLTDATGNGNTGTLNNFALAGANSNWVAQGGVLSGSVTPAGIGATTSQPIICLGESTVLSATGATSYTWTNGVIDGAEFSPTVTTTYTVSGTNTITTCTGLAVVTVTVDSCTSIKEVPTAAALKIYPNPTNGIVNIEYEGYSNEPYSIELVNILGEVVIKDIATTKNIILKTDNLNNGVYFIKISFNKTQITKRIIINK